MQRLKPIPKWGVLTQIYELKCRIHGTTRGEWSIAAYVHRLRALWQELDHYHNFQIACAIDAMKIQKMVEEGRIYEFLAGLNVEYDKIRVKILERSLFHFFERHLPMLRMRRVAEVPCSILLPRIGQPWLLHLNGDSKSHDSGKAMDEKDKLLCDHYYKS
jgi:hypothetical protein